MDRSFLSVITAVLNYAAAAELWYGRCVAEGRFKNIVDDMMTSEYPPRQSRLSQVRYVRFGLLMKKNSDVSPLLESLSESEEQSKELRMLYLDNKVLH